MSERYVDMKYLTEHTPWCRATIYNMIKAGLFPKQKKIGHSSYWVLSEVDRFLAMGTCPAEHQDSSPNPA